MTSILIGTQSVSAMFVAIVALVARIVVNRGLESTLPSSSGFDLSNLNSKHT